jgi:hypothetical protein
MLTQDIFIKVESLLYNLIYIIICLIILFQILKKYYQREYIVVVERRINYQNPQGE